jgi:hypothetical protein
VIDEVPQLGILRHDTSAALRYDVQPVLEFEHALAALAYRLFVDALGDFVVAYECNLLVQLG